MQQHSREMAEAGLPFILDPGQKHRGLFSGEQLLEMIDRAPVLVCNDYEAELICDKTGLTLAQLAARVAHADRHPRRRGLDRLAEGHRDAIAPVPAAAVKDPTGCGDAYRAGLLLAGWPPERSLLDGARLGSAPGSIKIAVQGCQNHRPTREEIRAQFEQHYGAWPF